MGNTRADALSKLASTSFDHLTKKVLVEVLGERSIKNKQVNAIAEPPNWKKLYLDYLHDRILPDDLEEARHVKIKAPPPPSLFAVKGM